MSPRSLLAALVLVPALSLPLVAQPSLDSVQDAVNRKWEAALRADDPAERIMELQEQAYRDLRGTFMDGPRNERVDAEIRKLDFILRAYGKRHEQMPDLRFMKELAADVDTLDLPLTGAAVHRSFAREYATKRRWEAAYQEMLLSDSLLQLYGERQESYGQDNLIEEREWWSARQDSILEDSYRIRAELDQAWSQAQQQADNWKWLALWLVVLFILAVALLLFRARRRAAKIQGSIETLLKQVKELEQQAVAWPSGHTVPETPPSPVDEAMKPVVQGLFKQAAPERLATLRDARQRGDTDKILRVVATLKPQLMAFDPDRFGPLIARLRASGAAANARQWTADLDALEEGVGEWLVQNRDR